MFFSTNFMANISVQPIEISIDIQGEFISGNTSKKITITNNNDYSFNATWCKEHPKPVFPGEDLIEPISQIFHG